MDDDKKVADLTVKEIKHIIEDTVLGALEEFWDSVMTQIKRVENAKNNESIDFEDEELYGDNGGE